MGGKKGALLRVLAFSSPEFFLLSFDFFPPKLSLGPRGLTCVANELNPGIPEYLTPVYRVLNPGIPGLSSSATQATEDGSDFFTECLQLRKDFII